MPILTDPIETMLSLIIDTWQAELELDVARTAVKWRTGLLQPLPQIWRRGA